MMSADAWSLNKKTTKKYADAVSCCCSEGISAPRCHICKAETITTAPEEFLPAAIKVEKTDFLGTARSARTYIQDVNQKLFFF